MSKDLRKRLNDLESTLPSITVSGTNADTTHFYLNALPTTQNLVYDVVINNPVRFVEVNDNPAGTATQDSEPYLVNSVSIKRFRDGVETALSPTVTITKGTYGADISGGFRFTLNTLTKSNLQARDRITVTFTAPNAVPVTKRILII